LSGGTQSGPAIDHQREGTAMGKKDKCCHKFEKKGKCCKGCPLKDDVEAETKGRKKDKDKKDKKKKDKKNK
jgi:hypothetical protein